MAMTIPVLIRCVSIAFITAADWKEWKGEETGVVESVLVKKGLEKERRGCHTCKIDRWVGLDNHEFSNDNKESPTMQQSYIASSYK